MNKKNMIIGAVLIFLFILAFAVRLFLIQAQPHITEDGVAYTQEGVQLINGRGFSGIYPPFYSLMIGYFSLLFKNLEFSGALVSVFFGALLVFPLFFIARWAFGNKVAIISCLLVIIYPNLCEFSSAVISESTFLSIFLAGLIISWIAISKDKFIFYFLAGLLWAVAYLTRFEGIAYFMFLTLIIVFKFIKKREIKYISYLFLVMIGFLIVSMPYVLYLKKDTGHWTLSRQPALILALGESVGGAEDWSTAFDKCYFGLSKDGKKIGYEVILEQDKGIMVYLISNPAKLIKRYIINLHLLNKYVIPELFYPSILILFAAGLFLGEIEKTRRALILFLAFIPYFASPFFIVAPRYFITFVPIILICVARGIVEVSKWAIKLGKDTNVKMLNAKRNQALTEWFLIIFVIISFIPFTFRPFLKQEIGTNIYKEIGIWIQSNLPKDSVLICRKPWIPFYAMKKQVPLPYASFDEILKFARFRNANYLIADESVIGNRLELGFLFDDKFILQDLKIVHKFRDSLGKKIYIYQILD